MAKQAVKKKGMFESDEIIQDVVDGEPYQILSVSWKVEKSEYSLDNPGQERTPTQVQNPPLLCMKDGNKKSLYTVILTDPDARDRKEHKYREWVHWVVVNVPIKNQKNQLLLDVNNGNSVIDYVGSGPPEGTGLHRYVFLVYEQSEKIKVNDCGQKPLKANGSGGKGRGKWKARKFAKVNKMKQLMAGNYYQSEYDAYVPTLYQNLKGNKL